MKVPTFQESPVTPCVSECVFLPLSLSLSLSLSLVLPPSLHVYDVYVVRAPV